ncbi:pinopsin-like [Discoglossus pictus]
MEPTLGHMGSGGAIEEQVPAGEERVTADVASSGELQDPEEGTSEARVAHMEKRIRGRRGTKKMAGGAKRRTLEKRAGKLRGGKQQMTGGVASRSARATGQHEESRAQGSSAVVRSGQQSGQARERSSSFEAASTHSLRAEDLLECHGRDSSVGDSIFDAKGKSEMHAASMSVDNAAYETPGPYDGPLWPHIAPHSTYLSVAVLMGIVVILAFVVNGLVIMVTIRYKKLRSPLNYILVNLAVADLLVTIFGSSVSFTNNVYGYFMLGKPMCELEGFVVSLTGIVGLWSLAILAFERYIVICKPLGDFRFKQRHAVTGCAFTWIWALIWTAPPLFGWSSYVTEGLGTSCGPNWYTGGSNNNSYILALFITCFMMPLSMIIFSYSSLLLTLKAIAAQQKDSETTQRAEREVTRMVIAMVLAFLICWLPYATFAMVVATNKDIVILPTLASLPSYFSKTATVYNPIIYVFMNKQFRNCLLTLVCCGHSPFPLDEDSTGTSNRTDVTSVSEGSGNKVTPA